MSAWLVALGKLFILPYIAAAVVAFAAGRRKPDGHAGALRKTLFIVLILLTAVMLRPWMGKVPEFGDGTYTLEEAESEIRSSWLTPQVTLVFNSLPPGRIISVDRTQGTEILINSKVTVMISRGNPKVPSLVGLSYKAAEKKLEEYSLEAVKAGSEFSNLDKDYVVSQKPLPESSAAAGSTVSLVLSLGKPSLPKNLIGMGEGQAFKLLSGLGVTVERNMVSSRGAPGIVMKSEPPPGTILTIGQSVRLYVSARQNGSITAPSNGASVFASTPVSGRADPGNLWYVFVYSQEIGTWHPQNAVPLRLGAQGTFTVSAQVGSKVEGEDVSKHFDLCLIAVTGSGRAEIARYLEEKAKSGIEEGMVLPKDASIASRVEVIRQ